MAQAPKTAIPGRRNQPMRAAEPGGTRPHQAARLQTLVDKQAICDVLAEFCERMDSYDIDGVARLFTEDCVTDYGPGAGGPLSGVERFRIRLFKVQGQFAQTHHQLGQVRVDVAGDAASSVTYVTSSHRDRNGNRYDSRQQYHDQWIRTGAGWRIQSRRTFTSLVDGTALHIGAPEGRNWVPRRSIKETRHES
jgi:ketosteroid isomerase-like protein